MDRDEIIRMAREAGWDLEWGNTTIEQVQSFAALVAAAEREACAKVCDELADDEAGDSYEAMCYCAYKIRARGGDA